MAKKLPNKPTKQIEKAETGPSSSSGSSFFSWWDNMSIVKSILFAGASLLLLSVLFRENAGYSWVWNGLINENLKFIKGNKNISDAQKMQSKFGLDAAVLDYIKNETPEDAVIMMPPYKEIINDSSKYQFLKSQGGLKVRNWALSFLYPRKLVYFDEKDKSKFYKEVTHVLILNDWGYDQVNYEVTQKLDINIVPVNKPSK